MDNFLSGFGIGLTVATLAMLATAILTPAPPSLAACAKQHNVYACKLVAVPVQPEAGR